MTRNHSLSNSTNASNVLPWNIAAQILFFIHGVVYATWGVRLPAVRDGLGLDVAQIGLVLLCGGIGSVCSAPVASKLVGGLGARRGALVSGALVFVALSGLAYAPDLASLMAIMIVLGMSQTCFNVSINSVGTGIEASTGVFVLSKLHAWYCIGCLGGALTASAIAHYEVSVIWHFFSVSLLLLALLLISYHILPIDAVSPIAGVPQFRLPLGKLLPLGLICFCAAIAEGAVTDWSSIYMRDHLDASEKIAPLAYAAFSASMFFVRYSADKWKRRYGARRIIMRGATLSFFGITLAAAGINIPATIIGFCLCGAGLAAIFPFAFSAAGRLGTVALAGVTTLGYSGILIGPPVIGFLAHFSGMQSALLFIGLMCFLIAVAAKRASQLS